MSVFRNYAVTDKAGKTFHYHLARNLNVERTPQARDQIIEGTFQVDSGNNNRSMRPFFYMDRKRKTLIYALPKMSAIAGKSVRLNWLRHIKAFRRAVSVGV